MAKERMYKERKANISAFRGCDFKCLYCGFSKMLRLSNCQACKSFTPHPHMEVLNRTPPKTKEGEFLTIGLSSDISFMDVNDFCNVLDYCSDQDDRTFLLQSKNPAYFLQFNQRITDNVIVGTTIESNIIYWTDWVGKMTNELHHYRRISQAPYPEKRYEAMLKLNCRKAVTIEPILDFDLDTLSQWIMNISPEVVWIGYDNHNHKLPEPPFSKTEALIERLKEATFYSESKVIEKTIRKAWYE